MTRKTVPPAKKPSRITQPKTVDARAKSIPAHPFPLLTIHDGLTSTKTYVVVAQLAGGAAILVRFFGGNSVNMKLYPTMAEFGVDQTALYAQGFNDFLHRDNKYDRVHGNEDRVTTFLAKLAGTLKGSVVASLSNAKLVMQGKEPEPDVFVAPMKASTRTSKPTTPAPAKPARKAAPAPSARVSKAAPAKKMVAPAKKMATTPAKPPVKQVLKGGAQVVGRKKFNPM